jgi:hypothetical protein
VNNLDGEAGYEVRCAAPALGDGTRSFSFTVESPDGWGMTLRNLLIPEGGGAPLGTAILSVADGANTYEGTVGSSTPVLHECVDEPPDADGGVSDGGPDATDGSSDAGLDGASDGAVADAPLADGAVDGAADATADAADAGGSPDGGAMCSACTGVTQPCRMTGLTLTDEPEGRAITGRLLCLCLPNRADTARRREITGPGIFNAANPAETNDVAFRFLNCEAL